MDWQAWRNALELYAHTPELIYGTIFVTVAGFGFAWWLRSHISKNRIAALQERPCRMLGFGRDPGRYARLRSVCVYARLCRRSLSMPERSLKSIFLLVRSYFSRLPFAQSESALPLAARRQAIFRAWAIRDPMGTVVTVP
jgi:hypothetical protein